MVIEKLILNRSGSATIEKNCANDLQIKIPVLPVKGYSATLELPDKETIKHAITDPLNRMVYSSAGGKLRVAGLADLKGFDQSVTNERIEFFKNSFAEFFPVYENLIKKDQIWSGLRSLSMDSLPIIGGSVRYKNLYYNFAHSTLGWTLAAGSAKLLIEILQKRNHPGIYDMFLPERFGI